MIVRVAAADDAEAIGRINVDTWRRAYRGAVPDEVLDAMDVDQRTLFWRRMTDTGRVLVAERDGRVIGYAFYGPAEDENETAGELYAIYVDPSAWGTGAGRDLMIRVLDGLRSDGYGEAMLWVLDENPRTRRFYERGGWTHDGGREWSDFAHATVVRYRIALEDMFQRDRSPTAAARQTRPSPSRET